MECIMKHLLLLIALAGTCFAFDSTECSLLQISQNLSRMNEKMENDELARMLAQPAATAEEQKLREQILKAKLDSMQRTGKGGRGHINASAKMSQVDQDKLAAKQESDAKYEAEKQFAAQQKQAHADEIRKFNAELAKSTADVKRCFPQSLDPKDPINAKAEELWKTLNEQKTPIVRQADAPFIIYSMAAAMLGIKPIMPR